MESHILFRLHAEVISDRVSFENAWSFSEYVNSLDRRRSAQATLQAVEKLMSGVGGFTN